MDNDLMIIPQYPEHSISEDGLTILNFHGRNITQGKQVMKGKETGYIYCTMLAHDYSYNKRVAVHRLVAFAWLPDPPTKKHVWINHKDGNKANNHADNLEWSTISQNIQHKFDTGLYTTPKGKEHWMYGHKASAATKNQMSIKKMGAKHPKFKGYYIANFKRFESANQAGKALNVSGKCITARCNNPKFKEKGYYFIPKTAAYTAQ